MSIIIRFLHKYPEASAIIFVGIVAAIITIWSVKRNPDKPESEKIGHKLGIRIRNLDRKIKLIRQRRLGKRQTRAELVDIATSIDASLTMIREILVRHQEVLIDLKEETNNPMTKEQIEAHRIRSSIRLKNMIQEVSDKKREIENRIWEGIEPYDENEKVKKRI